MEISIMLIAVIVIALVFDFLNGFHDSANAIATIVVTRTLTPFQAVILAGLANFVGYFFIGTAVAKAIGKGVVNITLIPHEMLLLDLYAALRPIDGITGATTADDILNRIFSTFCIGKKIHGEP